MLVSHQNFNCVRNTPKNKTKQKHGNETSQMRPFIGMLRKKLLQMKNKVFPCEFREVSKEFQNKLEALMF